MMIERIHTVQVESHIVITSLDCALYELLVAKQSHLELLTLVGACIVAGTLPFSHLSKRVTGALPDCATRCPFNGRLLRTKPMYMTHFRSDVGAPSTDELVFFLILHCPAASLRQSFANHLCSSAPCRDYPHQPMESSSPRLFASSLMTPLSLEIPPQPSLRTPFKIWIWKATKLHNILNSIIPHSPRTWCKPLFFDVHNVRSRNTAPHTCDCPYIFSPLSGGSKLLLLRLLIHSILPIARVTIAASKGFTPITFFSAPILLFGHGILFARAPVPSTVSPLKLRHPGATL